MESKRSKMITLIKYLCGECVVIFASVKNEDINILLAGTIELFLIFAVFNLVFKRINKYIVLIANCITFFLFSVQMVVLAFANSQITMMMLTSLNSIEDLAGKKEIYASGIIVTLLISMLPIAGIKWFENKEKNCIIFSLLLMMFFCFYNGFGYSPFYGYYSLMNQKFQNIIVKNSVRNADNQDNIFYKDAIADSYGASFKKRNSNMPDKPNVILIFTEGLSQSIIDDERDIMHNIKYMEDHSLFFSDYYNHTFATYRGIAGQLCSGYQLSDLDTNSLASMQSIFASEGYDTVFINAEPCNDDFTLYLNGLGFNRVISDDSKLNGVVNSISDKDVYELLYNTALEYNRKDTPFFLTLYTFGTHTSFDSPDEKYGEGDNAVLNRFYNVDCQFGAFMKNYCSSELYNNTIIVFTSDHATFQDDSFNEAFPNYSRSHTEVDEIPLFIFHNNVITGHINVGGRNSLDLAPTVFDFLDISAPNSFLGSSLFSEEAENECEYNFTDSSEKYTTKNNSISKIKGDDLKKFNELLQDYYIAARSEK